MTDKPYDLAVSALINDGQGRFLLLKRAGSSKHYAGQWEPPGGKLDPGETFEQGLIREVQEETGLTVELDSVAGTTEFELPAIKIVLLHMNAHIVAGEFCLSDEHEDFDWLRPEDFFDETAYAKDV